MVEAVDTRRTIITVQSAHDQSIQASIEVEVIDERTIILKLAFTTLGCPQWDLDTIISKAVEYGYQGVDFRGYVGEMDIYKLPEFSTEVEKTIEKFKDANLEVPCFCLLYTSDAADEG